MNKKNLRIECEDFILRDMNMGDVEDIANKINNIEVAKYLRVIPHPYEKKDAEWYINKQLKEQEKEKRNGYVFAIALKENNELIGAIGISHINYEQGTGEIGYWLAESFWGQKIMSRAAREVVNFAFNEIGLRRLDVGAAVENVGSNKVIKKLGFVHEGVKRGGLFAKATGKIHDCNEYGLLKEEWI
jgi:RimJ/RimL family protein N-acetyltransferase